MSFFANYQTDILNQALIIIIALGVYYNLWSSTKAYGGLIGKAVRFLGVGMLFIVVAVMERILTNYGVIENSVNLGLAQDILNVLGLVFLGLGFSKLAAATKA